MDLNIILKTHVLLSSVLWVIVAFWIMRETRYSIFDSFAQCFRVIELRYGLHTPEYVLKHGEEHTVWIWDWNFTPTCFYGLLMVYPGYTPGIGLRATGWSRAQQSHPFHRGLPVYRRIFAPTWDPSACPPLRVTSETKDFLHFEDHVLRRK